MPTVVSHVAPTLALGALVAGPALPRRGYALGALVAVVPDIDVVGWRLGLGYANVLGHRGLSHSLAFAAVVSGLVLLAAFPRPVEGISRARLWAYLFACGVSHGLLDALTNGGGGIAFFAPFYDARFFFPVRPIEVSPLTLHGILSPHGVAVMLNELKWIWLPSMTIVAAAALVRRRETEPEAAAG